MRKPEERKIQACIVHPTIHAQYTYTIQTPPGEEQFGGILYGLCEECVKRVEAIDFEFITHLHNTVQMRFKQLKEKYNVRNSPLK
jgi:hypothetical protein